MEQNNKSVLVVDDDRDLRYLLSTRLVSAGYMVYGAANGLEALEQMEQHSIDVVVMDHQLPGTNGVETASRIRRIHPRVPIISSSGCSRLPEGLRRVIDGAVPKGEGPEALIEVLYRQLWESHRYPAIPAEM